MIKFFEEMVISQSFKLNQQDDQWINAVLHLNAQSLVNMINAMELQKPESWDHYDEVLMGFYASVQDQLYDYELYPPEESYDMPWLWRRSAVGA